MHIRKGPTTKKQRISPLLLSGWYPPPGTLPNPNLLQRGFGSGASGGRSGGSSHHSIRDRAEPAHARSVHSHWDCPSSIAARRAHGGEVIATLEAARQRRIDQASGSRCGNDGAGAGARQRGQIGRKAYRRVARIDRKSVV